MKKGLSNIIVLALVFVNLVLTVLMMFSVLPSVKKTNNLVDKIVQIADLNISGDKSGEDEVGIEDLDVVPITFDGDSTSTVATLKLGEDETVHYVKISLSMSLNKKSSEYESTSKNISSAMSLIDSAVLDVVSKYTFDTVTKENIEKDIRTELAELFGSDDLVYSVAISQYLVQ